MEFFTPRQLKMQRLQWAMPADGQGSFAFGISTDDIKKALYNTLLVAIAAGLSYLGSDVIPHLQGAMVYLTPVLTMLLQLADKWVRDTRSQLEKERVPDEMYRQALKQLND